MKHTEFLDKVYEKTSKMKNWLVNIEELGRDADMDEVEQNIFLNILDSVVEMFEDNLEESELLKEE